MLTRGGEGEGNVGTRRLSDNMSDLEAQLAANQKVSVIRTVSVYIKTRMRLGNLEFGNLN